jgi:cysteine desulfurase/selenocysteine lyase
VGGDTVETTTYDGFTMLPAPHKFEAGLQDYAGIIGLGAAVNYIQQVGFAEIKARELALNSIITEAILQQPKLKLIGPSDPALRSGIASFYLPGASMHQFAVMLDKMAGIAIRSGQHCVHSWFNAHGIMNSARASVYFYNTEEEAKQFASALSKIMQIM